MAYVHIAGRGSSIGNGCILPGGATLAGHVTVESYATLSANAPVHQFCRIRGSMRTSAAERRLPRTCCPTSLTSIERNNHAYGLNKVSLQRRSFHP